MPWAPTTSKVSLVEDARLSGSLINLLHTNTHTQKYTRTQTNTHRHTEMRTHTQRYTQRQRYTHRYTDTLCPLESTLSIAQGVRLPWCSETHVVPCIVALAGSLCN